MTDWLTVTVDDEELGIFEAGTDDDRVEQLCILCAQHNVDPAKLIINLALDCLRDKFNERIYHPGGSHLTIDQLVIRSLIIAGDYHNAKQRQYAIHNIPVQELLEERVA